jgi:hypothetical protein
VNTATIEGYGSTAKALAAAVTPEGRQFAKNLGVFVRDVLPDIVGQEGALARRYTDWLGLRAAVRTNRVVSALAGKFHAEDLAKRYFAERSPLLARQLEQMHLDPNQIIQQSGILTQDQQKYAALTALGKGQLMSRVQDLPVLKNTAAGAVLGLFRSSAFQQSKAIHQEVWMPFVRFVRTGGQTGSLGPMTRFVLAAPAVTVGTGEAIRAIKAIRAQVEGREPDVPETIAARLLQDFSYGATLGLVADTAERIYDKGEKAIPDLVGGPMLGQAEAVAGAAQRLGHGRPQAAAKRVGEEVKVFGVNPFSWLPGD